jgi:hypothetical protein
MAEAERDPSSYGFVLFQAGLEFGWKAIEGERLRARTHRGIHLTDFLNYR